MDTVIVCGSGAAAFDIFDQGVVDLHGIRYYNANGALTRRVIHDVWHASQWSNPLAGAAVPYTQQDTTTDDLAIPGDFSSATETHTGEAIFHPAQGAPLFFDAGRVVTAPDGTIEFRAGRRTSSTCSMRGIRKCSNRCVRHCADRARPARAS